MVKLLVFLAALGFFFSEDSVPLRAFIQGIPMEEVNNERARQATPAARAVTPAVVPVGDLVDVCSTSAHACALATRSFTRVEDIPVRSEALAPLVQVLQGAIRGCEGLAPAYRWVEVPFDEDSMQARICVAKARIRFSEGLTTLLRQQQSNRS